MRPSHPSLFSPNLSFTSQGPTNPRSLLRTFGTDPTTTPPRVTLYRDHAAWCPYCAKVWLQLEAKRIPYKVVKINMRCYGNKPPEYMSRVPSGLLPALELDGVLHTDSAVIAQVLEAAFPDKTPLLPPPDDAPATARHAALMRLERQLFSDWLGWLCQGGGHEGRRAAFHRTLGLVEGALGAGAPGGGPFFMGAHPALADCVFAPFLERISASIPYYKGDALRGDRAAYPALNAWFDAMEAWPVYLGTKSDFYTHVHDLPPQLGGCAAHGSPAQAAMAGDIDGTDGASWSLPLAPLASAGPAAEWWPGEDPPADRLRAAARLVENARGVTRFAARGPAPPGRPAVSAPLSDPYARADEAAIPAIDAALRLVAASLLSGPEAVDVLLVGSGGGGGAAPPSPPSSPLDGALAASGLAYLRDRVGVPRDLPLPAARQLRAHLNWFVGAVGGDVNVKR